MKMSTIPQIVTTDWLAERLDDPNLRIVDATTFMKPLQDGNITLTSGKDSYNFEHIPGAVFADLMNELSHPDADKPFTVPPRDYFIEKMTRLGIGDKGTYTVIYDQGALVGVPVVAPYWASRLRWQLLYEGFENIAVLDGGLPKWKEEGRPLSSEVGFYPAATFTGERKSQMLVTKEEVFNAIEDESTVLINSLSPADFYGETNSYPRKGHIPGSANVFFGLHSNSETKEVLADEELRNTFEATGALDPNKKVITYCGGGIAATWNALILEKLGVKNVAVYDGSLNEWAADPNLPLTTGK